MKGHSMTRAQAEEELKTCHESLMAIKQEEVRRIKHLNRLGSWAQQDPTGPLNTEASRNVKEWVLNELKAALGSEWKQQEWEPSYIKLRDERDELLKQVNERKLKHELEYR